MKFMTIPGWSTCYKKCWSTVHVWLFLRHYLLYIINMTVSKGYMLHVQWSKLCRRKQLNILCLWFFFFFFAPFQSPALTEIETHLKHKHVSPCRDRSDQNWVKNLVVFFTLCRANIDNLPFQICQQTQNVFLINLLVIFKLPHKHHQCV